MSGNDFSSFDLDFIRRLPVPHHQMLWFRNRSSQFIFQQSILTFPIYALFRCNLLSNKSLLFVDFRAGYSTNQMYKGENQGGFFGSAGLGMNLICK